MAELWILIGGALALWAAWDIWAGYTYLHRPIFRSDEPLAYWAIIGVWVSLAAWCLMPLL